MRGFAPLHAERIVLRPLRMTDLEISHAYCTDAETCRMQGWTPPTLKDSRRAIRLQGKQTLGAPNIPVDAAIADKETGELLGHAYLYIPEGESQGASFGYTLAPAHRGQGLATEAVRRLLDFVFREKQVHRAQAITFVANKRSVALLERLGLRREGHFRKSSRLDDAWADDYVYAILRDEWMARPS